MLIEKDLVLARNGMVAREVLGVDQMEVAHVAHPVDWTMLEGLTIVSLFCLLIYFWIFMCSFFNPFLNTILISFFQVPCLPVAPAVAKVLRYL